MRTSFQNRFAPWLMAGLPLLFLILMLIAPVGRLLLEGTWSKQGDALSLWLAPWQDPYLRWRMLWSALQAALTCGLVLVLGVPIAWVLARFEFRGRAWVLRALMLPFVVPTLVAAMGVLILFGPQGWVVKWGGPN